MLHFGGVLTCFGWQRWYVETWISIGLGGLGREVWVVAVVFVSKVRNHIERLNVAPNIQSRMPKICTPMRWRKGIEPKPRACSRGVSNWWNGDISTKCDVSLADKVYDSMNPPVWTYQTWKRATRRGNCPPNGGDCKGVSPQKWPKHSGIGISSLLWSWCFHSPKDMAAVDFCWCFDRLQVLKFAWPLGRERPLLGVWTVVTWEIHRNLHYEALVLNVMNQKAKMPRLFVIISRDLYRHKNNSKWVMWRNLTTDMI